MEANNTNIIELKQVDFQYQGDAAFTLNNVSFKIPKNQWTSIVGHNGSGKSTIAKLIVGIEIATNGTIFSINHLSLIMISKIYENTLELSSKIQKINL